MAVASVTVTVTDELPIKDVVLVHGALVVDAAADTYATGGLALGVAEFAGLVPLCGGLAPRTMFFSTLSEHQYGFDFSAKKLKIRTGAGVELSAAAIPATVSDDVIRFLAVFDKFGDA